MSDERICTGCVHVLEMVSQGPREERYLCQHPLSVLSSLTGHINGTGNTCLEERRNPSACGRAGTRFEAKQQAVAAAESPSPTETQAAPVAEPKRKGILGLFRR